MNTKLNEKDFEKIYEATYVNTLKFITFHCYQIEDINDILQDTYVELFQLLRKKRTWDSDKTQSFINGIAKNIIKRHYAKKKKLVDWVNQEDETFEVADDFDLERELLQKEDVQKIWAYLKCKDIIYR